MKYSINRSQKEAFTIIEMVVSIVIIGVLFGGAMLLLGLYINTSTKSREMFQATYLAQECIEMGRNYRDSLAKQNLSFDHNLYQLLSDSINYNIDQNPSSGVTLSSFGIDIGSSQQKALINGDQSQFERTIEIKDQKYFPVETDSSGELYSYQLVCTVSWDSNQSVELSTTLTNWLK